MDKRLILLLFVLFAVFAAALYTFENKHPTGLASKDNVDEPLFQAALTIPKEYRVVSDGGQVLSYLEVKRIGGSGRMDVVLEYELISPRGEVVERKSETVAVETENSFVRYINLPYNKGFGFYTLSARVKHPEIKETFSEATFFVY